MKLYFAITLSILTIFPAFSGENRATEIDKVGKLKIEFGGEFPIGRIEPEIKAKYHWDRVARICWRQARFNIGCNWKLASGFINTKNFGRNGGIDYGLQYGFLCYYGDRFDTDVWRQHVNLLVTDKNNEDYLPPSFVRHRFTGNANFHYQFLKKLDTYVGFFGGIGVVSPKMWDDEVESQKSYAEKCAGFRIGATWYFNHRLGAGFDWEDDLGNIYGINRTGHTLNWKLSYLFSEKGKREKVLRKKQKYLERLRKDEMELEKWVDEQ